MCQYEKEDFLLKIQDVNEKVTNMKDERQVTGNILSKIIIT